MNTPAKYIQKAALAALVLCLPAHAMVRQAEQKLAQPASALLATQMRQCAIRFFSTPAAQNVCRMTAVGAFAHARNFSLAREKQGEKPWWSLSSLFSDKKPLQKPFDTFFSPEAKLPKPKEIFTINFVNQGGDRDIIDNWTSKHGALTQSQLDEALVFSSKLGRTDSVNLLLDKGANLGKALIAAADEERGKTLKSLLTRITSENFALLKPVFPILRKKQLHNSFRLAELRTFIKNTENDIAFLKDRIIKAGKENNLLSRDENPITTEKRDENIKKMKQEVADLQQQLTNLGKEQSFYKWKLDSLSSINDSIEKIKLLTPEQQETIESNLNSKERIEFKHLNPTNLFERELRREQQKKRTVTP